MDVAKIACALWLASVVVPTGTARAQEHSLTCSVVQIQCFQECGKGAGPMICNRYCTRKMNECMRTGRWIGEYGDPFTSTSLIRQ